MLTEEIRNLGIASNASLERQGVVDDDPVRDSYTNKTDERLSLPARVKRVFSNASEGVKDWRRLREELRTYPARVDENNAKLQEALSDYRLTIIGLSYKAEEPDQKVWDLYNQILTEIPFLKQTTFRRPLALRRRRTLQDFWQSWRKLEKNQYRLLDLLNKTPQVLESYNNMQILRKQEDEERVRRAQDELKIQAARQLLEIALGEVEQSGANNELVPVGSTFLRFEEARRGWHDQLEQIRQSEKTGNFNTSELLIRIRSLEEAVRDAPVSARWIRATEEKFARLMQGHDLLVSMGKSLIPQAELSRTTVMMYEQVPQLWATGDHEKLGRTLQGLEKFINYYSKSVEMELEIAERRRPGITQALVSTRQMENETLTPVILMTRALVDAIDSRDPFMKGHSVRVTQLALQTARKLDWTNSDLEFLEIAGLLHDVGKLSIPETILSKTTPLTQQERKIIQLHPLHGANIVKPIDQLKRIIPWVYHHQERWDGKGYPDGLGKKQIPMAASIIAVAEAYTAMTTDTPYREAAPKEEVMANIGDEAGRQFDPEVVDAFKEGMRAPEIGAA